MVQADPSLMNSFPGSYAARGGREGGQRGTEGERGTKGEREGRERAREGERGRQGKRQTRDNKRAGRAAKSSGARGDDWTPCHGSFSVFRSLCTTSAQGVASRWTHHQQSLFAHALPKSAAAGHRGAPIRSQAGLWLAHAVAVARGRGRGPRPARPNSG